MAQKNHTASGLLKDMAAAARQLKVDLLSRRRDPRLLAARDSLAADLGRDMLQEEAADVLAQAAICAMPIVGGMEFQAPVDWLNGTLSGWEQWVVKLALLTSAGTQYSVLSTQYSQQRIGNSSESPHVYDQFLHRYAPKTRKHHGVYFTPQPIADYIVRQIDVTLRNDFAIPDGLAAHSALRDRGTRASGSSAIRFLDPACGTGVFLLAVIDHLHRCLSESWNDFVPDLLPRLAGIELLPVPALLAKLNIARKLAETGYDFSQRGRIDIRLGDALSPNVQFAICNLKFAIPVILGNPPFSSLTTNSNPWIARLVRGDDQIRGYMQAGDVRLGERKTWLHDDYVKFIRLAQWIVEEADAGIVGFVTNHGYLDNATFRLMRQELLRVFPCVQIVDLHGNRKKGETAPRGGQDENIFGLDQGVAIGLFAKPTRSASEGAPRVEYADVWGTRAEKLASLGETPSPAHQTCLLSPQSLQWSLVPRSDVFHSEYAAGWPLQQAMPVNTTAPVTARDHFLVAFTREALALRIAEFRDLSIPDDEIRARFFNRTRSRRYLPGDTRSWKLAEARRVVAADDAWQSHIIRCLYRPFDWRYVFWHPTMVDWPRNDVVRHLLQLPADCGVRSGDCGMANSTLRNPQSAFRNLCLIARRQQLPTQPCTYFWVADRVALDGVIRSDNRGSESLFPLWLAWSDRPDRTGNSLDAAPSHRANFASTFVEQLARRIGYQPEAGSILAYIYALFHSPTYRERYAHELRSEFPRILLPRCDELFRALAARGQRLIELHLLRADEGVASEGVGSLWREKSVHDRKSAPAKDSRPPGAGLLDGFRVGGYAVLKKWLQPKHRSMDDAQYVSIVASVDQTIRLMAEIDAAIVWHGGFPAAFASGGRESLAGNIQQ